MVFDVGWFRVKSEEIEVEKEIPRSAERSGGVQTSTYSVDRELRAAQQNSICTECLNNN